jgi:hypothetical protein
MSLVTDLTKEIALQHKQGSKEGGLQSQCTSRR